MRYPGADEEEETPLNRDQGAEAALLASAVREEVLNRLDDYLKGGSR